jgi:aryl-alcohol dehydrogenase-like predicted oxidoreductase
MQYRAFGKTGVKVSEIGFGTWAMGGMWGKLDDAKAVEALNLALDSGVNFFDTAYIYGDGHSEQLIGGVIAKRKSRDQIYLATKVPPKNYTWPAKEGSDVREIFPGSWIREITEKSLKNLKMERIDLQQLHVWAPNWMNRGDWLIELEKLKREGKIRHFGISINDHEPDSALELVASGLIDSVQVIYNIFDQAPAKKLFPLCLEKKVAVIVRVPFDEGGLTGTLTPETQFDKKDWRRFYFKPAQLKETCERVERLQPLLDSETKTVPDLALKFCLADPAVSTVIPGMRTPNHVRSNVAVSDGHPLSEKKMAALRAHVWQRSFYPNWEEEAVLDES